MTPVMCGMDAQVLSEQQNFSSMLSVGLGWGLGRVPPGSTAEDASVSCRSLSRRSWDKRRAHLRDGSELGGDRSAARAGQRPRPQPWPFLEAGQRYKPAPVLPVPPSVTGPAVTAVVWVHHPRRSRSSANRAGTREHLCPAPGLGCSSDSPGRRIRKRP